MFALSNARNDCKWVSKVSPGSPNITSEVVSNPEFFIAGANPIISSTLMFDLRIFFSTSSSID